MSLISSIRPQIFRVATWTYGNIQTTAFPRRGLRILMYHAVGTPIQGDRRGMYTISPNRFKEHMRYLAEDHHGQLVSLGSVDPGSDELRIVVTFDDGYQDNLLVAAPLLVELGIPFTVFVCTGAVSGRKAGFLNPEQVRELDGMPGVSIGSHSVSHPRLTDIDDRRLSDELRGSKRYLEDLLGRAVDLLSYPEGAVNRRVRDAAESAGYRVAATSRFDINRPGRDPLLLCRTDIWEEDDVSTLREKVGGRWDWYRWRHADTA